MLIVGVARRSGCVAGRAWEKLRQRGAEKGEGKGEREAAGRARGVGHGNIRRAGGGQTRQTVTAGGGVTGHGKLKLIAAHPAAVVGHADQKSSCAFFCSVAGVFKNFSRAGMLENSSETSTTVP